MTDDLIIDKVVANGDCALTLVFKETSSRLAAIHQLCDGLLKHPLPNLCNVIPAKSDITLVFDREIQQLDTLIESVTQFISELEGVCWHPVLHEIEVCYDPEVAVDIQAVSQHLSVSVEELINRHSQSVYQVSMLGFLPGFAYLDGNDTLLQIPRKATPNLHVAAGSVAIAGQQTGIYALASPGGWHVIGRTPKTLLDWHQQQPMLYKPLDQVRFKPISLAAFSAYM
ncbi:MAG: 5-oxoprolinase subunit PxpB [Xanthomonadales bacterium]|nr:5-oxoprolinase subunit PxpB [Xanthomonadales bacterium]